MDKQRNQRGFTLPGSRPTPRTISYEDFRKQRDLSMSSRKSVVTTDTSSSIRKAKSDTDIAMQSLKKKAEVSVFNFMLQGTCH